MTELLYQTDAYLNEFTARVVARVEDGVVLDRTAFYPGGGGQPYDTGVLGAGETRWPVRRMKRVKGQIVHVLEGDDSPEVAGGRRAGLGPSLRADAHAHGNARALWRDLARL